MSFLIYNSSETESKCHCMMEAEVNLHTYCDIFACAKDARYSSYFTGNEKHALPTQAKILKYFHSSLVVAYLTSSMSPMHGIVAS